MQVITKLLYLLHQGETFTKVGAFLAVAYSGCMQHTVVADVSKRQQNLNCLPKVHIRCQGSAFKYAAAQTCKQLPVATMPLEAL